MTKFAVLAGKLVSFLSRKLGFGAGATWPGEIALKIDKNILAKISPKNVVLVAGTNGKTTTTLLLKTIFKNNGINVVHNASGANLLNGIVSAIITSHRADWGIFEVDENNLPLVLKFVKPKAVVLLNLFRDQLDRYGEVDKIAKDWQKSLENVDCMTMVNGDDPQLGYLKLKNPVYFGLDDKKVYLSKMQHATDSVFCPKCGERLEFEGYYFSHLGKYECKKCGFKRPKIELVKLVKFDQLAGIYNKYNLLAAWLVAGKLDLKIDFAGFKPAFGRSEEINGTKILLSKNPTGFNESLRTAINGGGKILLVLNDRIPDGRDISWIWDVDFEMLKDFKYQIYVSGERKYDLALRLKYAEVNFILEENLDVSWILPTYSAMLDIRKKLTGRKIL